MECNVFSEAQLDFIGTDAPGLRYPFKNFRFTRGGLFLRAMGDLYTCNMSDEVKAGERHMKGKSLLDRMIVHVKLHDGEPDSIIEYVEHVCPEFWDEYPGLEGNSAKRHLQIKGFISSFVRFYFNQGNPGYRKGKGDGIKGDGVDD